MNENIINNVEFLQQIFNSIQDGISILDPDFNIVWTNQYIKDVYAKNLPLIGKKCFQAYVNSDKICASCPAIKCFESGKVEKSIVPFLTPSGNKGWIELSVHPVKNNVGEVIHVIEYVKDITQYKKSEELVELLKYALDHVQDAVHLVNKDANFQYVNHAATRLSNYSKEQLEQMHVFDINPEFTKQDWPKHWDELKQIKTMKRESLSIRKDGTSFPVEISINFIEHNGKGYHLTFVQDITKRVEAQEELRFLQYALDNMQEAYFLIDEKSNILRVNKAGCLELGYEKEELEQMSLSDIGADFSLAIWLEHWNILKNHESLTFQINHKRKDGSIFPVEIHANYIKYHDKEYNLAFVRNITERKKMADELKESQQNLVFLNTQLEKRVEEEVKENRRKDQLMLQQSKMAALGEMISNIAHQWRQPISVIGMIAQNFLPMYKKGKLDENYLIKKTKEMMEQINYMSQTINDFRSFFSPKNEKKYFDIKQQIDSTINFIGPSFQNSGIDIVLKTDTSPSYSVLGYPNEVSQALLNILKNAKDVFQERTIKNPIIHIDLQQNNDETLIIIEDNGGGISPNNIDRIFEPYFSTKGPDVGTGIGLYMSKMIIEKHMNGTIEVKNNPKGACFTIHLPKEDV